MLVDFTVLNITCVYESQPFGVSALDKFSQVHMSRKLLEGRIPMKSVTPIVGTP